jgi:hypothetical protein
MPEPWSVLDVGGEGVVGARTTRPVLPATTAVAILCAYGKTSELVVVSY